MVKVTAVCSSPRGNTVGPILSRLAWSRSCGFFAIPLTNPVNDGYLQHPVLWFKSASATYSQFDISLVSHHPLPAPQKQAHAGKTATQWMMKLKLLPPHYHRGGKGIPPTSCWATSHMKVHGMILASGFCSHKGRMKKCEANWLTASLKEEWVRRTSSCSDLQRRTLPVLLHFPKNMGWKAEAWQDAIMPT